MRHRDRDAPWRPQQLWMGYLSRGKPSSSTPIRVWGTPSSSSAMRRSCQAQGGRVMSVGLSGIPRPPGRDLPGSRTKSSRRATRCRFDVHSTITRLMCLFNTTIATIPARVPYLLADPARVDRWRAPPRRLAGIQGGYSLAREPQAYPRSGSVLPAGPVPGAVRDRRRPAHQLAEGPRAPSSFAIWAADSRSSTSATTVNPGLTMMEDTPAIMMGLDLVITPDTALAHLAGALGVPVWVALPMGPDWPWMLESRG